MSDRFTVVERSETDGGWFDVIDNDTGEHVLRVSAMQFDGRWWHVDPKEMAEHVASEMNKNPAFAKGES